MGGGKMQLQLVKLIDEHDQLAVKYYKLFPPPVGVKLLCHHENYASVTENHKLLKVIPRESPPRPKSPIAVTRNHFRRNASISEAS
jgi:hypothetical protein